MSLIGTEHTGANRRSSICPRGSGQVYKLLDLLGIIVGGWIGWFVGAWAGMFVGFITSAIGFALGLNLAQRFERDYLE